MPIAREAIIAVIARGIFSRMKETIVITVMTIAMVLESILILLSSFCESPGVSATNDIPILLVYHARKIK